MRSKLFIAVVVGVLACFGFPVQAQEFQSNGPTHRIAVTPGSPLLGQLAEKRAVLHVEDYGSYLYMVVDAAASGGASFLRAAGAEMRDEDAVIGINGMAFDTADRERTARVLATMPEGFGTGATPSAAAFGASAAQLVIVQFVGPVRDAWLDRLAATGARIVSYMPSNAYVVSVDAAASTALAALANEPVVQWVGAYAPWMKLDADLRRIVSTGAGRADVVVQIINDGAGRGLVNLLRSGAARDIRPAQEVLGFTNLTLSLSVEMIRELSAHASVFAVEQWVPERKFDEVQGQIMAGAINTAGTGPTSPGYLAWLASKGFAQAGQFDFVVDVTDDGVDRGDTTNINVEFRTLGVATGVGRLIYNNNYTTDPLADGAGGHGNINASIIGGYNDLTGAAYEDAGGYNYGLGIAPFVKLGNTKVFANTTGTGFTASTTTRLNAAYNGGARISSNSWGFTTGNNYNSDSQAHDVAVRDAQSAVAGHQEMTIVFAAGNDGSLSNTVRPPSTGKNLIVVGASENVRTTGTDGCGIGNTGADNLKDIISFSSRGPCSDGRFKPDIMAPGTHIQGAASLSTTYNGTGVCNQFWPAGQTLYAWSSGTSHSTPAVSGAAALVRQYGINNGWGTPSPAMVKAVMTTTASHMTGVGANDTLPSNNQGTGLINLGRAFDGNLSTVRVDQTQVLGATGTTYTVSGSVANAAAPVRIGLVWTDAPGAITGNAWVNNLDLEVTVNGVLYRGNVFAGATSTTGGVADTRNNSEFVFLPAGLTGAVSITVRATNIAGDGVPGNADTTDQDFALFAQNMSTVVVPDFSLAVAPASASVNQGATATTTVSTFASGGFAAPLTLTATPAIPGATVAFATNPVAAGASSVMTVATTSATPAGTYTLTVSGTDGTTTRTATYAVTVVAPNFSITATPASATVARGATATFTLANTATGGFASPITYAATSTMAGGTFTWSVNPANPGQNSVLSVATTAATAGGTYPITITATGGGITKTTTVNVSVTVPIAGPTMKSYALSPNLAIPDANTTGITSALAITESQTIASMSVDVNIVHTYKGDLTVSLVSPAGTTRILHNRTGGATDNVITTYSILTAPNQALTTFNNQNTSGTWLLRVTDTVGGDVGTLVSWKVTFNGERTTSTTNTTIPDNNVNGLSKTVAFTEAGVIQSMRVKLGITHTRPSDLVITLRHPDGTTVTLHNRTTGAVNSVYPDLVIPAQSLTAFTGKSITGTWTIKAVDQLAGTSGRMAGCTLSFNSP